MTKKTLTLCFFRRKKKRSLCPTSIPALKLDMRGLRISITEGVYFGTVPTAHLFKFPKPRTELHRAELACYLSGLSTDQKPLFGLMWRVGIP